MMADEFQPPAGEPGKIAGFLKRFVLKSYLMGFGSSLVLGGAYFAFAQGTTQSETTANEVVVVGRQTLSSTVKAVGKVTFASEQQLKFNLRGTVAKVNAEAGDTVRKGQVIAQLDGTTAYADLRQSQLGIAASELQMEQLQADREKQIIDAQNAVNSAERQVNQAKVDLQKTRETDLQSLASTAQSILISSEKLLDSSYGVLTNDAVARPPGYITILEVDRHLFRDWSIKDQVELSFRDGVNRTTAIRQKYGSGLSAETDPQVILEALRDAQALADTVQHLSEQLYAMMEGSTTDSITFTVETLNALRATVNSNRTTAAGLVDDARTALTTLTALNEKNGTIPSITMQQKTDVVTTNQETTNAKQADLQKILRDIDISIQLKKNDIDQKSTSLMKLGKTLNDYRLIAPFDGVITHIDYKVGDNLLDTGDTEFATLQNTDFILITIPLDQVDVVKVRKDMRASIVFDAVPGRNFDGVIDQIDSTPITTSGVVSYNVSIRLPTPKDLNILSGMTATVQIEIAKKENALVVPNLSLKKQNGGTTVQKGTGETTSVTTGMTDGRYTEILSGLSEGDSILAVNLASGASSSANAQQIFRGLGGLGGGGPPGGGR